MGFTMDCEISSISDAFENLKVAYQRNDIVAVHQILSECMDTYADGGQFCVLAAQFLESHKFKGIEPALVQSLTGLAGEVQQSVVQKKYNQKRQARQKEYRDEISNIWGRDVVETYQWKKGNLPYIHTCAKKVPNFGRFLPHLNVALLDQQLQAMRDYLESEPRPGGIKRSGDLSQYRWKMLADKSSDELQAENPRFVEVCHWVNDLVGKMQVESRKLREAIGPLIRYWGVTFDKYGVLIQRLERSAENGSAILKTLTSPHTPRKTRGEDTQSETSTFSDATTLVSSRLFGVDSSRCPSVEHRPSPSTSLGSITTPNSSPTTPECLQDAKGNLAVHDIAMYGLRSPLYSPSFLSTKENAGKPKSIGLPGPQSVDHGSESPVFSSLCRVTEPDSSPMAAEGTHSPLFISPDNEKDRIPEYIRWFPELPQSADPKTGPASKSLSTSEPLHTVEHFFPELGGLQTPEWQEIDKHTSPANIRQPQWRMFKDSSPPTAAEDPSPGHPTAAQDSSPRHPTAAQDSSPGSPTAAQDQDPGSPRGISLTELEMMSFCDMAQAGVRFDRPILLGDNFNDTGKYGMNQILDKLLRANPYIPARLCSGSLRVYQGNMRDFENCRLNNIPAVVDGFGPIRHNKPVFCMIDRYNSWDLATHHGMGRLRMSEASLSCGFLATAGATTLNYKSDSTLYYRVLDGELHGQITKGRNQYHFWISADHILFVPGGYVATFTAITAATVATQVVFDLLDVSAIGSLPSMLCPAPPVDYEPMEVPENIGWSKPKFAFNKRRRLSD